MGITCIPHPPHTICAARSVSETIYGVFWVPGYVGKCGKAYRATLDPFWPSVCPWRSSEGPISVVGWVEQVVGLCNLNTKTRSRVPQSM